MKTNKRWYLYPRISYFFKPRKGMLYAREMPANGSLGAETEDEATFQRVE